MSKRQNEREKNLYYFLNMFKGNFCMIKNRFKEKRHYILPICTTETPNFGTFGSYILNVYMHIFKIQTTKVTKHFDTKIIVTCIYIHYTILRTQISVCRHLLY